MAKLSRISPGGSHAGVSHYCTQSRRDARIGTQATPDSCQNPPRAAQVDCSRHNLRSTQRHETAHGASDSPGCKTDDSIDCGFAKTSWKALLSRSIWSSPLLLKAHWQTPSQAGFDDEFVSENIRGLSALATA